MLWMSTLSTPSNGHILVQRVSQTILFQIDGTGRDGNGKVTMNIQTLELNKQTGDDSDSDRPHSIGFWKRQFIQTPTPKQTRFDWAYGVGIPLICAAADPFVFVENGMLGDYKVFAHMLSATSIMAMAAWLLWGQRLGWMAAPLGGLFIAGSFVSFVVGVLLLPYTLIGMFFMIGLLGFTPLLSGLVYLRNGLRAINASGEHLDENSVWRTAVLAAMLALVIPYVANANFSPATNREEVRRHWNLAD